MKSWAKPCYRCGGSIGVARKRRVARQVIAAAMLCLAGSWTLWGSWTLSAAPPAAPESTKLAESTEVAGRTAAQYAEQLQDQDRVVRLRAVRSLGALGHSAGEPLVGALQHDDPAVRYIAAVHLGRMAGKPLQAAQPALETMVDRDGSQAVRLAAAFALCRLGDVDAHLPLLITAVQSTQRARACSAAELIGNLAAAADAAVEPLEAVYQQNRPGVQGGDYHIGGAAQNALRKIRGEDSR